jgi:chromosome segregation ATPase
VIALVALAAVLMDQAWHPDWAQAPNAFLASPPLHQLMIVAVLMMTLYVVVSAVWQTARASRKSKELDAVVNRRNALLDAGERAEETQRNLNSAVEHLVSTDPDNALMSLHQRVTKAELLTAVQRGRNTAADMDTRLADIRRRQQGLREQLGEVTEARRAIAPVFDELRERQIALDRAIQQVEGETDTAGRSVADRMKNLTEAVTHSQTRLKALEDALVTVTRFRADLIDAKTRMDPLQASDTGLWALMAEQQVRQGEVSKAIDAIEQQDGEQLSARVEALGRSEHETERRLTKLIESATLLEAIRGAFDELGGRRERLERSLQEIEVDPQGRTLDDRQNELAAFADQSRARLGTLEHTLTLLNRFRQELDEYQRGLAPLQSASSGIEAAIADLHVRRDRLHQSLLQLEVHDEEKLPSRVEAIYRDKVSTEQRIAEAVEHFSRLDSLRKDVDGLFAKLRFTIERLG